MIRAGNSGVPSCVRLAAIRLETERETVAGGLHRACECTRECCNQWRSSAWTIVHEQSIATRFGVEAVEVETDSATTVRVERHGSVFSVRVISAGATYIVECSTARVTDSCSHVDGWIRIGSRYTGDPRLPSHVVGCSIALETEREAAGVRGKRTRTCIAGKYRVEWSSG